MGMKHAGEEPPAARILNAVTRFLEPQAAPGPAWTHTPRTDTATAGAETIRSPVRNYTAASLKINVTAMMDIRWVVSTMMNGLRTG